MFQCQISLDDLEVWPDLGTGEVLFATHGLSWPGLKDLLLYEADDVIAVHLQTSISTLIPPLRPTV